MTKIKTCSCSDSERNVSQKYIKVLRCPWRWKINDIIKDREKSTRRIYEELKEYGEDFTMQGLYYHLSKLNNAGIVALDKYVGKGKGAPEKIWKLKTKTIKIDLVK